MNRPIIAMVAAFAISTGASPILAQTESPARAMVKGVWMNPKRTVAVRTASCGEKLCGRIVWANPTALKDARDSGVQSLIGTELLQDYQSSADGRWSGTLYVPDMGGHFSSTITPIGASSLRVKGCLIGGFICKSQIWQRIAGPVG